MPENALLYVDLLLWLLIGDIGGTQKRETTARGHTGINEEAPRDIFGFLDYMQDYKVELPPLLCLCLSLSVTQGKKDMLTAFFSLRERLITAVSVLVMSCGILIH